MMQFHNVNGEWMCRCFDNLNLTSLIAKIGTKTPLLLTKGVIIQDDTYEIRPAYPLKAIDQLNSKLEQQTEPNRNTSE